ncbi:transposase [Acidithiobacillus sp. AMEEHan]|uniref:transposase n=1 Tax=Acidithiobacillus sp. AMEEHan TaxID=2994951 RepID=UPI0027E3C58C|nr:transposase [Acidithiobacillus sp. AMEEHan]
MLKAWVENVKDSGLPPMVKVAYTVMKSLGWCAPLVREARFTNGILEGFNSLLQSAKAKARGYPYPQELYQHGST